VSEFGAAVTSIAEGIDEAVVLPGVIATPRLPVSAIFEGEQPNAKASIVSRVPNNIFFLVITPPLLYGQDTEYIDETSPEVAATKYFCPVVQDGIAN
jgi:hypothetical protein